MSIDRPNSCSLTRRELLRRSGMGFAMLGLAGVLNDNGAIRAATGEANDGYKNPLAERLPHFPVKAKRVIHLFMNGGPSHVDTFDPKPSLEKYAGKPLPTENLRTERKTGAAFPSPFKFQRYGQSGIEVSELFQHTAQHIDDIAVIRSMHADVPNHEPSLLLMNCGESRLVRPSLGSWLTYGLGTENLNLPGFIAMVPNGYPIQSPWLAVSNRAMEMYKSYLAEFGLSPAARCRVALSDLQMDLPGLEGSATEPVIGDRE